MIRNPFITNGYAGPEYFCDRETETSKLTTLLTNGNNVVLISPRRMGKTGLLYHCFQQPEIAEHYNTFVIDIYSTKCFDNMVLEMGKKVVETLRSKGMTAIEGFLNIVRSLKPGVSFDASGNPTWSIERGSGEAPQTTLDEIFAYINKSDKPCIVAIDEFQQIVNYPEKNVEEILRTHIQQCQNAVFVFSGSEQHLLREMFNSPARPFYSSSSTLQLGCINLQKYAQFAVKHFDNAGKRITEDAFRHLYERFEGTTWFIQKTLNYIYSNIHTDEVCDSAMVDEAIAQIIDENSTTYAENVYQLTMRQQQLLKAISMEGKYKEITGSKFIRKYNLGSPSTIQTTIKSLLDKQIVTSHLGVYEVYDKLFALWLRQQI